MTGKYRLFSMKLDPQRREAFRGVAELFKDKRGKVPPKSKLVDKGIRALIKMAEHERSMSRGTLEDILGTHDYVLFRENVEKRKTILAPKK